MSTFKNKFLGTVKLVVLLLLQIKLLLQAGEPIVTNDRSIYKKLIKLNQGRVGQQRERTIIYLLDII